MWLINTSSFRLEQVLDPEHRKFAILSHTWDAQGEVTFQDIQDLVVARKKPGFSKIERTCHIACSKYKYVWIDTCCIDKSSSAELSEAINSMFHWYRCADLCYVYLSDFEPLPTSLKEHERKSLVDIRLATCRWFTRGWTLQELIAPRKMDFLDQQWTFIGGKSDLEATLAQITNVDSTILNHSTLLSSIPVARRMSWAARRKTTRVEDMAYCLLGIFDINMPLLYGEGEKAFYRLQQQLASENNDLSLFAWQSDRDRTQRVVPAFGGIFAASPDDFKICSTLKRHHDLFFVENQFAITNTGLRMDATLHPCPSNDLRGDYLLSLNCVETSERTSRDTRWLAIYLRRIENTFVRARPDTIATAETRSEWIEGSLSSTIYIQTRLLPRDIQRIQSSFKTGIVIMYDDSIGSVVVSKTGKPEGHTQQQEGAFVFNVNGRDNFLGLLTITLRVGPTEKHTKDIVLVCCLQWTGACCELITGLYSDMDYARRESDKALEKPARNYAKIITELSSTKNKTTESECLKEVKDMMMTRYSDLSGVLVSETIPSKVKIVETVDFNGKTSSYQRSLRIKQLKRGEHDAFLECSPRRDYFHAVLECEPGFLSGNIGRWTTTRLSG